MPGLVGCRYPAQGTSTPSADATSTPTVASKLSAERLKTYREADAVVVARLVDPKISAVLEIDPPIFIHEISLAVDERVLGVALPSQPTAHFRSREQGEPFAAGAQMLVGLRRIQENLPAQATDVYEVVAIDPLDVGAVASLRAPVVSEDLAFTVRQVAPAQPIQWTNDYGDGVFELVVENRGASPITVPSLLRNADGSVDWSALVIRDDADRALVPSKRKAGASGTPVVLAPGASIQHTVDVKPLGLLHPMGGYRAYYSFHVDQLRASSFFYFSMNHHGPMMGSL